MRLELTRGRLALAALLVGAVVLLGAAVLGATSGTGSTRLNYSPLATATRAPTPVAAGALPGGASPDSSFVMVQGIVDRRLVVWLLAEGGAPREVDRGVKPWPLVPDPAGQGVVYRTTHALMVLDVRARRSHIVAELPEDGAIRALQWSPDGSALAYVLEQGGQQTAYTVRRGGDQPPVAMLEAPAGLPLDVAWLADGRPVVVSMGVGPVGGLEAHRLAYDPATDERVLLPPDTPLVQPHAPWRSPDGRHQLYSLASADMVRYTSGCRTGALGLAGEEWVYLALLGGGYERQQAFKLRDVVLDLALWLPDGRVLMRGVADEGCAPGASGIYVARLGEEPRQLIQTGPFVTRDDDGVVWGAAFDLSPDRMLIAWARNDVAAREASIHLTPVDGGPSALLFAAPPPPDDAPFAFEDTTAILDFVWLP